MTNSTSNYQREYKNSHIKLSARIDKLHIKLSARIWQLAHQTLSENMTTGTSNCSRNQSLYRLRYPCSICYTEWFKIIVGISVTYNFRTGRNKIKLLECHERRACWSCLALWGIDAIDYKTFWVTLSYSIGTFILMYSVWKLYATKTPTII
jgi:hypothetical protein